MSSNLQKKILSTDSAIKYASSITGNSHVAYTHSGGRTSGSGKVEYIQEQSVTQNFSQNQEIKFRIGTSQGKRNIETCSLVFEMTAGTREAGALKFIEGAAVKLVQWIQFKQKGIEIEKFYLSILFFLILK